MSSATWRQRAAGAVRPSVEALLLAAVAFGCAQAGWTLLTPSNASAVNTADANDGADLLRVDIADVQSPFAPDAGELSAQSHAITALLSSVELKGVRMSEAHERSGAMFSMGDGGERAFMIGQEIADGVTLADVDANYVLLAYDGGERRLELSAAPSYSFARAMMGLEPAPGAPQPAAQMAEQSPAQAQAAAAVAESTPQDRAWLAATLAQVEMRDGQARGWRVAEPTPQAALAAGLRGGDLVLAVNGAGPANALDALASARAGHLQLDVERGAERLTLTVELGEPT